MAKKFQFRLEGLLKLCEFCEQEIKVELGNILKEIAFVEDEIVKLHQHIDETYQAQENVAGASATGRMMGFFPAFVSAKNADIAAKENILFALRRKYDVKLKDMYAARGESKVIQNLKEKEQMAFKKSVDKKMNLDIEENSMITRSARSEEEGESA